jgi:hypothetical protein
MTPVARLFALLAGLVGALAGGCSLLFSVEAWWYIFVDFDITIVVIWISGFGLCALLIWLAVNLWRT